MSSPLRTGAAAVGPSPDTTTFLPNALGTFEVGEEVEGGVVNPADPQVAMGWATVGPEPVVGADWSPSLSASQGFQGFPVAREGGASVQPAPAPRTSAGRTAVPEGPTGPVVAVPPRPLSLGPEAHEVGGPPPAAAPAPWVVERLESGRIVGTYRLEDTLGTGATATVWRAIDLRFKRPIALKLFHARGAASQRVLDRVMGEAQSASSVISDHVVRVRDAGQLPDGGPHFIAMELCAAYSESHDRLTVGLTLEQDQPQSLDEALRWGEEIARGVYDAHRVGVFHRDLKPANVLVRPGTRTAQILDFGLATLTRPLADGTLDVPTRTISIQLDVANRQPLCIAGTPAFMAPEQCRGLPWDLDPQRDRDLLTRVDVYGIGAVLYTLLAGHEPYLEDPEAERSARVVMDRVADRPPRPLRRIKGPFRTPPRLVRIVEKAMARDPADRYAHALELAEDLAAYRAGRPTSQDRDPFLRVALYARRNKLQMITALWVIFLVLGGAWSLYASTEMKAAYARMEEARAAEAMAWQGTAEAEEARAVAEQKAADAMGISEVRTQEAQDARAAAERARTMASKARSAEENARTTAESALAEAEAARLSATDAATRAELAAAESADARRAAATSEAIAAAARGAASAAEAQRESALAEAERQRQVAESADARAATARSQADAAEARANAALERASAAAREAERAWQAAQSAESRLAEAEAGARQAQIEAGRWKDRALRAEGMLQGAGGGGGGQPGLPQRSPEGAGGASNYLK